MSGNALDLSGQELLFGATAGLTLIATLAAAWPLVLRSGRGHASPLGQLADALASGVFLGVSLLHILPQALHEFVAEGGDGRLIFLVVGISLLLLRGLDRLGRGGGERAQVFIVTGVLVLHVFLTGFALGTEGTHATIFVLFLALAIHKAVEAFAFGHLLARAPISTRLGGALIFVFVAALPVGVWAALTATRALPQEQSFVPLVLAIGAGTFLHLGLNHAHLPGASNGWRTLIGRMAGFALMAAFAFLPGH